MNIRLVALVLWIVCLGAGAEIPARGGSFNAVTSLHSYSGCKLMPTEWADGDSFSVKFPNGEEITIRLYGMDCFETSDRQATDQRRLRAQRQYFGLSKAGGNERASIAKAMELGKRATESVRQLLREPFTVHTAWADGRGDPNFKRYYGFITAANGRDLGELLVEDGLARAHGVARAREPGVSQQEYRARLKDLEMAAASRRAGSWAFTDWSSLPEERRVAREEEEAEAGRDEDTGMPLAVNSINPNTASRDELMRLPRIGEVTAIRIMEEREEEKFHTAEDLKRVSGIGESTLEEFRKFLTFK